MSHYLNEIEVSPKKEAQFAKKKILTVEDLLRFFPREYYDFRAPTRIADLQEGATVMVKGRVTRKYIGRPDTLILRDENGNTMRISFFSQEWVFGRISVGETWCFGGRITRFGEWFSMVNPILVNKDEGRIYPVYSKIKGMSDEYLSGKISAALMLLQTEHTEDLRDRHAKELDLIPVTEAYTEVHYPTDTEPFRIAKRRIDFEVIYDFYERLYRSSQYAEVAPAAKIRSTEKLDTFLRTLPFELTNGQTNAISRVRQAAVEGKRLDSIISGDVGCGKTIVAIAIAILMQENGYQTAVMAPTLVLAKQHYEEFAERLSPLGIRVGLITGETKKRERNELLKRVANGEIDIIIGTHALLTDELHFRQLGATIIDEEHKFGVRQKEMLDEFDAQGAHHIKMTATPIPRSFALSVYGDSVEIITIPDMPKGRKETVTEHITSREAAYDRIYEEIQKGHQAYLITPCIEESESENYKDIASVKTIAVEADSYFRSHGMNVRVGSISGDMKQSDVLHIIDEFAAGKYDLLISTTIVEVGVNVPNATIIAVLNADRFGLAGLHQLRGRVGRKGDQGYCLLVSEVECERLDILCRCHNGFEIAELDMKLRGAGDLIGERQSGDANERAISTILRRPKMAAQVREFLQR